MGPRSTSTPGRDGGRLGESETASPSSIGGPVHQGADSLYLDRISVSAPRFRPPCRDGLPILSGPVPVQTPWVSLGLAGCRQGAADLRRFSPPGPPRGGAGRALGHGTGAGLQAGRLRLGSHRAGGRAEAPAVVRGDPLGLVAPGSRLPGKSLQVGATCWLLAGWERSAGFELMLDGWADFGLSRFSASRGLDELDRAKLVSVGRMPGRSPVVTIREVAG